MTQPADIDPFDPQSYTMQKRWGHDRTDMGKKGLDSDYYDPLHDEIVQYLCRPESWKPLCKLWDFKIHVHIKAEQLLVKGRDKWLKAIGYPDVVAKCKGGYEWVVAEVKTGKIKKGDVIRQLGTYGMYLREGDRYGGRVLQILMTAEPLRKMDVQYFNSQGIEHVVVGDDFVEWQKQLHQSPLEWQVEI